MHTSRQHNLGFTLIEMLVVIAVVIIVASVTIPMMAPFFKGQSLSAGSRTVQAMLFHARSEAISKRTLAGVYLYRQEHPAGIHKSGELVVCYDSDKDGLLDEALGAPAFVPEGVSISITVSSYVPMPAYAADGTLSSCDGIVLVYQPNGLVQPGYTGLKLAVEDMQGGSTTITVPGYMGR